MWAVFYIISSLFFTSFKSSIAAVPVKSTETDDHVILENGYVKISFDKLNSNVDLISADFSGFSEFSKNILSKPFGLEVNFGIKPNCLDPRKSTDRSKMISWLNQSSSKKAFQVDITDCDSDPFVSENWIFSLEVASRSIELYIKGGTMKAGRASVLHGIYTSASSIYGLFDRGVAQMMNSNGKCLGSNEPLSRAYMLGNGVALDVIRGHTIDSQSRQVVLMSEGSGFHTGMQDLVIGDYPSRSLSYYDAWSSCWKTNGLVDVEANISWSFPLTLIPNNFDFPVYLFSDVTKQPDIPFLDLQSYLTGIYASPVGCLQSYFDGHDGTIAPTISHPDVGYSPDTNFFDPDNFIALSAMMYSGDDYLMEQVRAVIEKTGESMCGIGSLQSISYCGIARQRMSHVLMTIPRFKGPKSVGRVRGTNQNTRSGQLMHHFVSMQPTYGSIAGSEQLGPNVFWTMTVLRYFSITQDLVWAEKMFPFIDLSTQFITTFFDESMDLISAPGPLWIDVIVRENYTSDSNAIIVPLFLEIADFYDLLGIDSEFASLLRSISARVSAAMNKMLWVPAETRNSPAPSVEEVDHYITQLNPDGTTRDFVDFDSNLIAVAFGIASDDQSKKIFDRVDAYEYSHVRATWCSEVFYTGDREDCYIVGGSVCGDSIVTLARIGWVDALARKRMGDVRTFEDLLLAPLQKDLIDNVWLCERYDANSTQIRTAYYFEYPSFVAIMLREIRYGINIGLASVEIAPFPAKTFSYSFGSTAVSYSASAVTMSLPGAAATARRKQVRITGLKAESTYRVKTSCSGGGDGVGLGAPAAQFPVNGLLESMVVSDASGVLTFPATFSTGCEVSAVLV